MDSDSAPADANDSPRGDASVIDSERHPAIRRVVDVMRSTTPHPRTLLIDDEENIAQAVAAGVQLDAVYVAESAELPAAFAATTASVFTVNDSVSKALFKTDKRSRVFALARAPRLAQLRDLATLEGDIVVLDGVRIAGNIGAIIRSAVAFGAAGVVLLDSGLATVFDRRLIRASRGLVFALPVLLTSAEGLTTFLRSERMPLASLAANGDEPLSSVGNVRERMALLFGSERTGASAGVEELATSRYSVPMNDGVESLNVSVAAGITLYERARARA